MSNRIRAMGVFALCLLVAGLAAGCNDNRPNLEAEPSFPASVDVASVKVVYASQERQPPFLGPGDYDPLWGDLDADKPVIDRLLRSIAGGIPVKVGGASGDSKGYTVTVKRGWGREEEDIVAFDGRTWLSELSLVINIRFLDDTTWAVRQVIECDVTSEGRLTHCLPLPDHWELIHRDEFIVSKALTKWFGRVEEYMPRVEMFEFPESLALEEPLILSGTGYHEGDRVELSIEFSDGSKMALGGAPLDHGAFHWEVTIPDTAASGPAKVTMQVLDGSEVVAGMTVSPLSLH